MPERPKFMAALYGYFDESGKSHQHDVVSFSGFIASWKRWESLGEEWRRLLIQHGIPALHFTEHKKRASLMKKFIRLIKQEVEYGVSLTVNVKAFNALPEALRKVLGNDPHYVAFKSVMLALSNNIIIEPGSTLSVMCDEDEATNKHLFDWYKKLKK